MNRMIPILILLMPLAGCATEFNLATGQQESLMYGTEKEVSIGDAMSKQLEQHYKVIQDRDVNERLQNIARSLVKVCDRRELVYTVRAIEEDEVNAVSLPGGYVYVFKGLLDKLKDDDQLAGVIAHEIGHITAKHAMKRLQASYGYTLLQVLAIQSGSSDVAYGVNALFMTAFLAYSQGDELEADRLAVKYTRAAEYNPQAMIGVLEILRKEASKKLQAVSYFRTHPYINERIAALNKEIRGSMDFKDYLNLTGSEK